MKEQDRIYMNKEPAELHDPNPADEVFASVKALIAWLALVGCVAMVALAFWKML